MNAEAFLTVIATPDGLRDKFVVAYRHAESLLANGERVELRVQPALDPISALQRGFLHAAVLPQVAEQAFVGEKRERYTAELWKPFFFKLFVKPKYEMRRLPGAKRATPYRTNTSSEQLGVRAYSKWIDQIIDYSVLELNVAFEFRPNEREGARYVAKPAKEKRQ